MDVERRLADRILAALELAIEQADFEVAEHLKQALELAMTRFGGVDHVEKRDVPREFDAVIAAYGALRDRVSHGDTATAAPESHAS
ncbi:MAG: hypothetical protein P4M00_20900 [Azospirillaceae bacterium]|nr:hypothetical protein [Azospirillaceae bacterium]